jgi:ATPase subunit of ABC transporter with duplicated ATPase domains
VLFRLVLDELEPDRGEIRIGPSVKTGYYAQRHETLDPDRSLIDTIAYSAGWPEDRAVALLGRFLFSYEQARGLVKNLSGGERSRLQMALLMISGPNFLLLDEPTNNLDPPSREAVARALVDWPGSIIFVSHDTDFVRQLAPTKVLLMPDGDLDYFSDDWLELVEMQ